MQADPVSTTPIGTPASKRHVDAPLSASKSKLQSIMKTARGLFTSSAGVSAQAKMETLSPASMRTRGKTQPPQNNALPQSKSHPLVTNEVSYPHLQTDGQIEPDVSRSKSPERTTEGRKTRSSTEKEAKRKEQKAKDLHCEPFQPEQAPEEGAKDIKEVEVAPTQPPKPTRQSPRRPANQAQHGDRADTKDMQATNGVHSSVVQLGGGKPPRRPGRPAKEAAAKPKLQPVAIRTMSQRTLTTATNTTLSSTLQESLPPAQPKQPGLTKNPSSNSLQTSASNQSLKASVNSAVNKPKALIAAEKKKEQVSGDCAHTSAQEILT